MTGQVHGIHLTLGGQRIENRLPRTPTPAQPVTRVGEQRVNRAAFNRRAQLIDALQRGEVGFDRLDLRAEPAEGLRRFFVRPVGGDHEVEAVLGAQLRKLVADAARSPRHHR